MLDDTLLNEEEKDVVTEEETVSTNQDELLDEQSGLDEQPTEENGSEEINENTDEVLEESNLEDNVLNEEAEEVTNDDANEAEELVNDEAEAIPEEDGLEDNSEESLLEEDGSEEDTLEESAEDLQEESNDEATLDQAEEANDNSQEEPSNEQEELPQEKHPKKEKNKKEKKPSKKEKKKAEKTSNSEEEKKPEDGAKDDQKDKSGKSKSKVSKTARRRRFLIFIVTLYLDLLLAYVFFVRGFFSEFVNGILNGHYLSLQEHYGFVIASAMVIVFLVINFLAIGLSKDAKKIKGEQNNGLLDILGETDNIDGRNITEEEYALDEGNKVVYRTSRTVEWVDMNKVYNDFIKYALSEGIAVDKITAREMFASIASCRLIFVKNDNRELRNKFLAVFAKFFGVDFHMSQVNEYTNNLEDLIWNRNGALSVPTEFAKGLQASRQLPDKINMAFLENVNPATMNKYFKELLEYCKNPEVPCFVKIGAKNVDGGLRDLPKNLWFILCLEGDELVPSEVAKYSITLQLNIKEATEVGEAVKFKEVSYPQLVDAINEAYENNFIAEEMWKKLDEFEDYLAKRGEYFIDNRIVREIERFAAIYLLCEGEQTDLIDTLLSKKLLLIALPNTYTYLENDEETIMGMAEKIIGADYISNSQAVLKQIKTN